MLRSALALASALRMGAQIKQAVRRRARTAAVAAVAVVFVLMGLSFGLVAGYFALVAAQFTPAQAAGLIALAMILAGLLALAALPLFDREPPARALTKAAVADGSADAVEAVNDLSDKAMRQVGPLGMLMTAFAIGLAAGRR